MRRLRVKVAGRAAVYHCLSRVVGGQFLLGAAEKEAFKSMLRRQARFCGVQVITHCVMSNHFHVLVRTPAENSVPDDELVRRMEALYPRNDPRRALICGMYAETGTLPEDIRRGLVRRMGDVSLFMKELKQRFSKWFNKRHQRSGALWSERYRSVLVEDRSSVVSTVAAYIDLNPVRAGLADDPKDYRWCGYAEAVAGHGEARAALIGIHRAATWSETAREYRLRLFVHAGSSGSSSKAALTRDQICEVIEKGGELSDSEILRVKIRYFSDGMALGSREFVEGVFSSFRSCFGRKRRSGARRMKLGGPLGDLCSLRDLQTDRFG